AQLVTRPTVVTTARHARSQTRVRPHRELRRLLAPPAWRWRHTADGFAALFAGREALATRQRRRAPVETGPVAAEAESFAVDDLGRGAVALAGLSAYAAGSRVTRRWPVRAWGAAAYALMPVATGAVAGGRLDVVVALVLAPLVVRAIFGALRPMPLRSAFN